MMSRIVTAFNPITNEQRMAALVIDPGSTESYLSKRISDKLHLSEGPIQCIDLVRFGDEDVSKSIQ